MAGKRRSQLYLTIAFILAQIAWLGLLGLWIYWYVSNYIIFKKVGDIVSPQIVLESPSVLLFVGGIILIVGLAFVLSLTFRYFTVQLKLTGLYDNFIANVTHELKSPLSSIHLYLETMNDKPVPPEKQKEFIGLMLRDTNRLQKLINSILEVSRLDRKYLYRDFQVYRCGDALTGIVRRSMENFRLPEPAFSIHCTAEGECVIDTEAMQMVFDNLTDNAVKYSPGSVEIAVSIGADEKNIIIRFADKGIGIDEENYSRIFSKFERLTDSRIPNVKGVGLGLYLAKEIIRSHGGRISVVSGGIEKGSTFIIELPCYSPSGNSYINRLLKLTIKRRLAEENDGR